MALICSECGQECRPKKVDLGIGPYEFWGQRCIDHNWQVVSDCCWAEIEDYDVVDYDADEWEERGEIKAAYDE